MPSLIKNKLCYATVGNMSKSGTLITLRFASAKADADAIFTAWADGEYVIRVGSAAAGYDSFLVNAWFQKTRSSYTLKEAYAEIVLVFDTQSVRGLVVTTGSSTRYDPVYSLSAATEERPIEQHPRFKCPWAYNLYELVVLGGTTSPVPAWANVSDASCDTNPNAIHDGYLWSRTPPTSPDAAHEYKQVQEAQKPGVDSYLIPRPVVTSTIYYRSRQIQQSDLIADGKLKAPPETYIYGNTQSCWLVTGCSVNEATDDLMSVTTNYQYVEEGWDLDIYDLFTPQS